MSVSFVGLEPHEDDDGAGWSHLPVASRMTGVSELVVITPEVTCREADAFALARRMRHLLIVEGGELAGVVCRCDLHPHRDDDVPVRQVMAADVLALDEDATLGSAAHAMRDHHIGCLPIVINNALAGVITRGDLRRAGAPEEVLGAAECCNCGSRKAVRPGPHCCDFCLDCIDLLDGEITDADYGEGD